MDVALNLFSLSKSSFSLINSWATLKYGTSSNKMLTAEFNSDNKYLLFNYKP